MLHAESAPSTGIQCRWKENNGRKENNERKENNRRALNLLPRVNVQADTK